MGDLVGIPFGSYRLLRRIALGGMAEVFLARQTGLEGFDRLCAVKRILPHLVASREFVDMFLDEARLAAQLRHPNAVHIYDFGKVEDSYFIAMEFVDGVAAGQLIKHASSDPLPFSLVARIGAGACAGLDHAHNLRDVQGNPLALVHRDVSPPNLLVSYDGGVKLVDFGIAKAQSCVEHTRPGVVKGKYAYMSPEQTIGQVLDGRSDVFSLGIVLWELITGQPAVRRDDPIEGMKMIRDGKLAPVTSIRPDTPPELARAIAKALELHRDDRASALELGMQLERFIKGSSGMSSNLDLAQWLRTRFPRRDIRVDDVPAGTRVATQATHQVAASSASSAAPAPRRRATDLPAGDRTEISPPLFPSSGLTEIAVSLDAPPPQKRSRLMVALLVVAAIVGLGASSLMLGWCGADNATEPAPVASAAAAPAASLEVITDPVDATIKIADRTIEGSPAKATELAAGTYTIEVSHPGYRSESRILDLGHGERRTIELSLQRERVARKSSSKSRSKSSKTSNKKTAAVPRKASRERPNGGDAAAKIGFLRARSIPYADVYLKKRKLGQTPLSKLSLPVGKHRLRFVNPENGVARSRTVTIKANETTRVTVKLPVVGKR